MNPRRKGILIGMALGIFPAAIALIPYSVLWYHFHGTWYSTDIVSNLEWILIFVVCWMASYKGLEVAAGWYLRVIADGN